MVSTSPPPTHHVTPPPPMFLLPSPPPPPAMARADRRASGGSSDSINHDRLQGHQPAHGAAGATVSRAPNFDILPPSSTFATQAARYAGWTAALNASSEWHRGVATPHPQYDDLAFFVHDAGVVRLSSPVNLPKYGAIPPLNWLDRYSSQPRNDQRFETVGYGLERVQGKKEFGGDTRLQSHPKLDSLLGNPSEHLHRHLEQHRDRRDVLRRLGRADVRQHELERRRRGHLVRTSAPIAAASAGRIASTSPTTSRSSRGSASTRSRLALAISTAPGTAGGRFVSSTSVHGGAAYDGGTPLPEDPPMPDHRALLHQTADLAADYLDSLATRPVGATATRDELLEAFGGPMPARGEAPGEIVDHLGRAADPGIVASAGPRYFGFVIGGSLPSAVAADWLTTAWDQNGFAYVMSPAGSVIEEVTAGWLLDAFGLPARRLGRVRERGDDGDVHGARGGASPGAAAGGLGRRGRRPDRRARDRGRARRRGPRDRLRVAPDGRAREPPRPQRSRPTSRAGCGRIGCARCSPGSPRGR